MKILIEATKDQDVQATVLELWNCVGKVLAEFWENKLIRTIEMVQIFLSWIENQLTEMSLSDGSGEGASEEAHKLAIIKSLKKGKYFKS